MPISVDFETQLRGPWETAQGFLVDQLELLQAQISPIFPLIDGIQSSVLFGTQTLGGSGYPSNAALGTDSLGTPLFNPYLTIPLGWAPSLVISPVQLTANTNDYSPPNLQTAAVMRISASGAIDLTGVVSATVAHAKLIINVGTNTITLKHASASSSTVNRFRCPGAADFSLTQSKACWIWYDTSSTVWQVMGS